MEPIGLIHTPFTDLAGMPIQPAGAAGVSETVEVFDEYQAGLKDLDGYSHVVLLYVFHRSEGFKLQVAAGIIINLVVDRTFKAHDTTVKPFEEPSALVTTGVFAISRNPMYIGMTLILLGMACCWALSRHSLSSLCCRYC